MQPVPRSVRRAMLAGGTLAAALIAGGPGWAEPSLILVNGDIRTVDPDRPKATALAVEDGKFAAIGTDDEMLALKGEDTDVMDLDGRSVLPGFVDGHTHLSLGSGYVTGVNLSYIPEKSRWLELIAAADARLPEGAWITGGGWDHTLGEHELPTKEDLDAVVPDRPIVLRDIDFHSVWTNSKALELAGVTADSEVPPGGEIMIDTQTGEPTGILLESAARLVYSQIPPASDEDRVAAPAGHDCLCQQPRHHQRARHVGHRYGG